MEDGVEKEIENIDTEDILEVVKGIIVSKLDRSIILTKQRTDIKTVKLKIKLQDRTMAQLKIKVDLLSMWFNR